MKKWRKHRVLFLIMICIAVLIGCSRTKIIDKISIVQIFGFDQAENGELIGTALFPDYTKSKDGDQIQSLEEQAVASVLVVSKMAEHTSNPIEVAKLRVILFGKNYAEAGIGNMAERLLLTPQLGTHVQIATSTQSARDILLNFKKEKSLTLSERIEQNMEGQYLPKMNLHIFLNHFYGEGMDAYVPMITLDEKNRVMVNGMGVFKDDKLKLHLNREKSTLFSYVKDYQTPTIFKINLNDQNDKKEFIIVRSYHSKKDWHWDKEKEQLYLRLNLKISLTQYPNKFNVEKQENFREIEKIVEKKIEKGILDLVETLKKNEVDPIGIGNIVRSKDSTWEEESFYKKYPTLPIHVNVKLEIIHSGLKG